MDDLIFNCPHCQQELAVEATGAGSDIECPSCGQTITIPQPKPAAEGEGQEVPETEDVKNPILSSAAAKEEKHFSVPQHKEKADTLIKKPMVPLEASAKQGISVMIKTFKRSDCVEVGKDHFDEVVSKFLEKVGETNIISVNPITYSHQDLASHAWIADFGVMIVYRG